MFLQSAKQVTDESHHVRLNSIVRATEGELGDTVWPKAADLVKVPPEHVKGLPGRGMPNERSQCPRDIFDPATMVPQHIEEIADP